MDFNKAIELYTLAIEKNPNVAIYYANRSFAYLKTECFGYALTDASKAVELDKTYVKGYYRRAAAYMSLGKFKEALKNYEYKAISVEDNKRNIADSINLEAMTIENEYTGPELEDGKVTLKFMKELMELYKNQGKLHRKYAYKVSIYTSDINKLRTRRACIVTRNITYKYKFSV
ncbi:unnamed protein product [Acanthoscelides obtectus]|uniref:PPP domain-containing protein n=1 Tax=Acanthoscelides obtectus TaxID=200917 RepID=A0A9P0VU90_ACAOB|nr:unnamed protein product [Acanthoscelides obtectus]CAK1682917.1 Serine/threonine-protein phosphatase 5 [Acanthoscelides obtectus]